MKPGERNPFPNGRRFGGVDITVVVCGMSQGDMGFGCGWRGWPLAEGGGGWWREVAGVGYILYTQ